MNSCPDQCMETIGAYENEDGILGAVQHLGHGPHIIMAIDVPNQHFQLLW